ncbi:calponin homology domain-containing protein DDB_G0272472 isoform X2 [Palaemon carinicauda]
MRRMKIRAVPNIGSGGNLQRVNLPKTKPPDGDSTIQSAKEPSNEKNSMLPVQSVAGASSKSGTVSNLVKERKTAITIDLDSCDEKPAEVEIDDYKSDHPTLNAPDSIDVSKNYNRDKNCSDVEILPKFSCKKIPKPLLANVDDEVQEVAISESIQCLGAYKKQQSPHMPSFKDPLTISRNVESECSALSYHTAKNSVSDSSKSNLMSPKHIAHAFSPSSNIDCLTDDIDKGKPDNMGSRNKEVAIDNEEVMSPADGKKVITLGSDKVSVDRGKGVEKTPPAVGTLTRRPKIRAKPSFSSNLGKKAVNPDRKAVTSQVIPVINSYTEDVILEEGDGEKDNLIPKVKDVTLTKNRNEIKIQASQNLVAKSQEITLDDSNETESFSVKKMLMIKAKENNGKNPALDNGEKSMYSGLDTTKEKSSLNAVHSNTEDVILEEGGCNNDNSLAKTKWVKPIKDMNEIKIQVAKSKEITLDDSNETKPVSSKEVLTLEGEENNGNPRVHSGNLFEKSGLDKREKTMSSAINTSHEKSSPNAVNTNTEDVILEEVDCDNDNSLGKTKLVTPIKDLNEIKIQVAKSKEITLDDGNETKAVSSKEVLTLKGEENNGNPRVHCGSLLEKSGLDKGEKTMSSTINTSHEKSSPNAIGPSVRRRKISAKPSLVKYAGRKQTGVVDSSKLSNIKKENDQDKEACCLTIDQNSKIGISEIEEKKTKCVDENESGTKQIKDSCNALSSVLIENKLDLLTSTENTSSVSASKLSESDLSGNASHMSSENSSPGQVRTTESGLQVSNVESLLPTSSCNNMRRSRIRAKPSLFTKRKTLPVDVQEDLVESRKENEVIHSVDKQAQARLLTEKVSDEKEEDNENENNTYHGQATPDDVNSQTQARILSEKISAEKSIENKIEKNTGNCEAIVDEKFNSKEVTENLDSVCKSLIVKKRQFTNGGDNVDTKSKKIITHNRKKLDIGELVSDDSGGNKENSSKCLIGKAIKRERNIKVPAYSKSKPKLLQLDSREKKLTMKSERKLNISDNSDSESEESMQKRVFRERKEKFRKKLSQSQGNIERGQMTMFDLIFWNPIKNPMPGRTDINKKKDNISGADGEDAASDILEEQMVDDLGLESKSVAEESRPNSPGSAKDEVEITNEDGSSPKSNQLVVEKCEEEESEKKDDKSDEESVRDVFAPQVKIGPNGQIILDEQSIKIQTTAAKNRDEILSKAEVVEESNDTAHYGKWNKKRRRSCEWTMKETARFYKALSTVGTDFSLMETLFNWRSRAELKTKFKKEERTNRELVDRALKDCTQFDFTPFDEESDYDPEEDRKASRIAERAEAKRKRLEMKQIQKEEEKLQKKMLVKENKNKIKQRQVVMRKLMKEMKSKKEVKGKAETDQLNDAADDGIDASDSDVEYEPVKSRLKISDQDSVKDLPRKKRLSKSGLKNSDQDPVKDLPRKKNMSKSGLKNSDQAPVKNLPKKKRVLKRKKPKMWKSSSPLEISEVTVTMETVKSQRSEHDIPVTDVTGCEMTVCEDVSILESTGLDDQRNLEKLNPDTTTASLSTEPMSENHAHNSSSSEIKNKIGSSEVNVTSSQTEGHSETKSVGGDGKMWDIPLTAVKVDDDGTRFVNIPTEAGEKVVPVPHIPPGTSSILVVASKVMDPPGEFIYHVYTISPLSQE